MNAETKHCLNLTRHEPHEWERRELWGKETYWCKGFLIMEGGHFGPRSLTNEEES